MLKIRLARKGRKKVPVYWMVVADARAPRDGRFLEKVGTYHPLERENKTAIVEQRARYWLSCGAQPTDRVSKLFQKVGILPEVSPAQA